MKRGVPGLGLLQLVDLVRQFVAGVLLLLPELSDLRFVLEGLLLHVTAHFDDLLLALLVHLDLGGSGTTSLVQPGAEVFQFTGNLGTLALNLKKIIRHQFFSEGKARLEKISGPLGGEKSF